MGLMLLLYMEKTNKQRMSDFMKNLWEIGTLKPKKPWNKGISTKKLGKSRPLTKKKECVCLECKKIFSRWEAQKPVFCSRGCAARFQGKYNNPAKFPGVGDKISKSKKGKSNGKQSKENHPMWQGGKSFEPYSPEFDNGLKEAVRKRDGFKCTECSIPEEKLKRKLSVHHIDYNKKNNDINNLISLCDKCHAKTNWERPDWEKYFNKKVIRK